jgi:hypothetical protein
MMDIEEFLSDPWRLAGAFVVALVIKSILDTLTRPKDLPPFYSETSFIPWLGLLFHFAINPREFFQRAAQANGDVFTVQLFGKNRTFLTVSEGHAHFFKARDKEFDIRDAYRMTVTTFGPRVCYDCPQAKMAQQCAFFKDRLSDESFFRYIELVKEEVALFFEQEWGVEGEADLL